MPISSSNRLILSSIPKTEWESKYKFLKLKSRIKNNNIFFVRNLSEICFKEEHLYTNSTLIQDEFSQIDFKGSFKTFHSNLPNILSSLMVFPEKGSSPRIINTLNNSFVVVNLKHDDSYIKNYELFKEIFEGNNSRITALQEVGIIFSEGNYYFISKFVGFDYETLILDSNRSDLKEELFNISVRVERTLYKNGYFWRNLSPRNIIKGFDGKTYLIDYDNLFSREDTYNVTIFKSDQNRRLWYADIFSEEIISKIFIDYNYSKSLMILANEYDTPFMTEYKPLLTPNEYKEVFKLSTLIEQPKKSSIPGHILGRFISDYWEGTQEIEFAKYIYENQSELDELILNLFAYFKSDQALTLKKTFGLELDTENQSYRYFKMISEKVYYYY